MNPLDTGTFDKLLQSWQIAMIGLLVQKPSVDLTDKVRTAELT